MRTTTITTIEEEVPLHPVNGYEITQDQTKGTITSIKVNPVLSDTKQDFVKDGSSVSDPITITLKIITDYIKVEEN